MRRLYNCVVVPKMLYAVDVWGAEITARLGSRAGRKGYRKLLERVLRMHALTTTGAMKTTATDTAVAHANLLPIPFQLQHLCFRAYARMCTLPIWNPIYKEVRSAARQHKRHKSPLHHLAQLFPIHPKNVEEIRAPHHPPEWIPSTDIHIDGRKEDAVKCAEEANEEVQIFTDGSGHSGGIGAAAILRRRGRQDKILCFHLGSETEHTVYNAEQIGMLLGAKLLWQENNVDTVYMGVDNQAAIRATISRDSHSGHTLTDMFLQTVSEALDKHNIDKLIVRWVPGHTNVAGNELVDAEAKKVAEGDMSTWKALLAALRKGRGPKQLPLNKSALIQHHTKKQKSEIRKDLLSSTCGKRLQRLDSSAPLGKFTNLTDPLPRRHASALIQLCTSHVPLNHHLARIGKLPTISCPNCRASYETVHHLVLMCLAYQVERRRLQMKIGSQRMRLEHLLTSTTTVRDFLRFLTSTRHLAHTFGNLTLPECNV